MATATYEMVGRSLLTAAEQEAKHLMEVELERQAERTAERVTASQVENAAKNAAEKEVAAAARSATEKAGSKAVSKELQNSVVRIEKEGFLNTVGKNITPLQLTGAGLNIAGFIKMHNMMANLSKKFGEGLDNFGQGLQDSYHDIEDFLGEKAEQLKEKGEHVLEDKMFKVGAVVVGVAIIAGVVYKFSHN